ncbi:E22 family MetX-like putative esterase [Neptunicella marina]|uniref:Probable acyltransferase n=1 Tax=Neptunicella marina TaxID=2125989 RepID=A0A8J6IQN4_9ALTE|nr:homoserine O-acetyltransferase [Neptunicella marina]MBC3764654.1 homoserine O-acetyltransferase [Neptunicella marina]
MRLRQGNPFLIFTVFLALLAGLQPVKASERLVEKQRFSMPAFTTFNGSTIKNLQVGFESYGKLNREKSNVILITHYFSGSSHAAGKYSQSDAKPGYWDTIIGPGKAIDTNQYFVISVDTLVNLNVGDKNVITTGPASINPDTGKPYGLSFPVVTIRDFVNVQKAVLESLGIDSLYAVIGASMGSMQALDWAVAYPDKVPRMISVIGSGEADAWTTLALEQWTLPIKLDPNWNKGDYYSRTPPMEGLTASLMMLTQQALHPEFINAANPHHNALDNKVLNDINQSPAVVDWLRTMAEKRAQTSDANHLLYLVRANQLYIAGHNKALNEALKAVKARCLFLPSNNDLLLMPYMARQVHNRLLELHKHSYLTEIQGNAGHLNGLSHIQSQANTIAAFLADKELP